MTSVGQYRLMKFVLRVQACDSATYTIIMWAGLCCLVIIPKTMSGISQIILTLVFVNSELDVMLEFVA